MNSLIAREIREVQTVPESAGGCLSCIVWPMMQQCTHGSAGGGDYGQRLRDAAIAVCLELRQDGACTARAVAS